MGGGGSGAAAAAASPRGLPEPRVRGRGRPRAVRGSSRAPPARSTRPPAQRWVPCRHACSWGHGSIQAGSSFGCSDASPGALRAAGNSLGTLPGRQSSSLAKRTSSTRAGAGCGHRSAGRLLPLAKCPCPNPARTPAFTHHAGAEREHCGGAALGTPVAAHWPELPAPPPPLPSRARQELLLWSGRGQQEAEREATASPRLPPSLARPAQSRPPAK